MINQFFPEKTIKRHSNDKPFITNKIKVLIAKEIELSKVIQWNSLNHYEIKSST
jgi:hypothetical protein